MRGSIQPVLSALAAAFTVYLAVGALLWPEPPTRPVMLVATFALYLVVALACIFWGVRRPSGGPGVVAGIREPARLPLWLALVALAVAVAVPNLAWYAAGTALRFDPVATRSLGAVGALLTIVLVRGRPWIAWGGIVALTAVSFVWVGPAVALERGLVGAFVWVGSAHLVVGLVRRSDRDLAELSRIQRAAAARIAAQEGARRARRRLVQRALAVAGPVLARAVRVGGRLGVTERAEARIAEETLRDELRGSRLLDAAVRAQLDAARRRGATVSVLDEGGLEDLGDERLAAVRSELAGVLARALTESVWVRTSTHPDVAVTVVGRDGDEVALWHEIAR